MTDKCEFCNGAGKDEDGDSCAWCWGTGNKDGQKLLTPPEVQRHTIAHLRYAGGEEHNVKYVSEVDYDRVVAERDALLAKPADQHQGEPAAWLLQYGPGTGQRFVQIDKPGGPFVDGREAYPLYTHADPGEVEQFPHGSPANKAVFMALESYTGTTTFEQACIQLAEEAATLRTQLAERDALLGLARQFVVNGVDLGYIHMPDAETPDPAHDLVSKIDAALSASAEPSAPDCDHCAGAGHDYYGEKCAHCKSSTPVERDELKPCPFCGCQVTFLTGREDYRIAGRHSKTCPFLDVDLVVDSREAWQARATLERKP